MVVVVSVTVPPGPVFLLFFRRQLAKIAMGIAVVFAGPLVVVNHFVVIPDMVVAVVRVIHAVVVMCARRP